MTRRVSRLKWKSSYGGSLIATTWMTTGPLKGSHERGRIRAPQSRSCCKRRSKRSAPRHPEFCSGAPASSPVEGSSGAEQTGEGVHTDMREWTEIRHRVLVEGASKRSVCREFGIAHKTLQKILANTEPPGYRATGARPKTKLGPYLPVIEEILAADAEEPPKQRHTAKRIFERLRDEYGYPGGITQVKEAVARSRRHHQEVFVPLSHPPGEAQFDFGYATVAIAGMRQGGVR